MGDPSDQVGTYRSGGETEGLAVIAPIAFAEEDEAAAAKAEELTLEPQSEGDEGDKEVEVETTEVESDAEVQAEEKAAEEAAEDAGFDPGEHTVAEVVDFVEANPDQRDSVLAAEKAGKNRSTLVNQLSA